MGENPGGAPTVKEVVEATKEWVGKPVMVRSLTDRAREELLAERMSRDGVGPAQSGVEAGNEGGTQRTTAELERMFPLGYGRSVGERVKSAKVGRDELQEAGQQSGGAGRDGDIYGKWKSTEWGLGVPDAARKGWSELRRWLWRPRARLSQRDNLDIYDPTQPSSSWGEWENSGMVWKRWLGGGGMGEVYEVERRRKGGRVETRAIKMMMMGVDNTEEVAVAEREAVLTANLPAGDGYRVLGVEDLVRVRNPEDNGEVLGMVMEKYPEGAVELKQQIKEMGERGDKAGLVDLLMKTMTTVGKAVDEWHKRGLYHRDLKLEHALIDGDEVILLDLGVANWVNPPVPINSSSPPERQISYLHGAGIDEGRNLNWEAGGNQNDAELASELFMVAAMVYHGLSGELPLGRIDASISQSAFEARIQQQIKPLVGEGVVEDRYGVMEWLRGQGVKVERLNELMVTALARKPEERWKWQVADGQGREAVNQEKSVAAWVREVARVLRPAMGGEEEEASGDTPGEQEHGSEAEQKFGNLIDEVGKIGEPGSTDKQKIRVVDQLEKWLKKKVPEEAPQGGSERLDPMVRVVRIMGNRQTIGEARGVRAMVVDSSIEGEEGEIELDHKPGLTRVWGDIGIGREVYWITSPVPGHGETMVLPVDMRGVEGSKWRGLVVNEETKVDGS